ncbi:MAG: RadC family protein [Tepidiformaceae bacterium]
MADSSGDDAPAYRAIREFADDERPRERLLKHGPDVLADAELVAIILGSGLPGANVLDLARAIVEAHGGLAGLVRADPKALQRTRGMGPAKAAQLAAALELGRRMQTIAPEARPLLTSPEAVFALLGGVFNGQRREELHVLSLDSRGRLLGRAIAHHGTVNAVQVRAADVFREALISEAVSIVLVHNHPSGDPSPSPQDIRITGDLVKAGEMLDISILDHLIVGQNSYVSMQREGFAFRQERPTKR